MHFIIIPALKWGKEKDQNEEVISINHLSALSAVFDDRRRNVGQAVQQAVGAGVAFEVFRNGS